MISKKFPAYSGENDRTFLSSCGEKVYDCFLNSTLPKIQEKVYVTNHI